MLKRQSEEQCIDKDIIHLHIKRGSLSEELDVYRENTMGQVFIECRDSLKVNTSSSRVIFINERAETASRDLTSTIEELNLEDGDTMIIGDCNYPDATMVSHFGIVNNTAFRLNQECPKKVEDYHELYIAYSGGASERYIQFYICNSCLRDIIAPYSWMPKWFGSDNPFTGGKQALLIVNEKTGKCAMPSEFDTLISEFVGNINEPGRLFVILEENICGMHLEKFSFGD